MPIVECVPNVSEGRRTDVLEALAGTLEAVPGVRLLDWSADVSHNRSVFTLAGSAGPLGDAVLALFEQALARIDLRTHRGAHPRIGAVDVVPFVPLEGATMAECVELARSTAARVAARFQLPVYLYEEAAVDPARRRLEDIRRGGLEGLAARMSSAAWRPDHGPAALHVTGGATAIGARRPLVAFNVNLGTDRLDIARQIAVTVRSSGGGLPHVKAIGVRLEDRGIVQVSMNLTNLERTPIFQAFEAVRREAARHGVAVLETEVVGLVPAGALADVAAHYLLLGRFGSGRVLELKLRETDPRP